MIAEIIKILDTKESRNGNTYLRVEFKGVGNGKWYKTDLCSDYRNWHRWEKYLKVGNILDNLRLKDSDTIDADSYPFIHNVRVEEKTEEEKVEDLKKLAEQGIFG
jgi:hypothetical protein